MASINGIRLSLLMLYKLDIKAWKIKAEKLKEV